MCRDLFQHPVGAGSLRSCLEGFTEGSRGAAGLGSIPGTANRGADVTPVQGCPGKTGCALPYWQQVWIVLTLPLK